MSAKEGHRFRSATWHSLQTLTRALRESLRLRKLKKQKRLRNEENEHQMRRRSKSVGNAYGGDDEMSEAGISIAVNSDIGPVVRREKFRQQKMPRRKISKSVDEVELSRIQKTIQEDRKANEEFTVAANGKTRRRSKDDLDLPSVKQKANYYVAEQKGFRKRFGQLFGSLRKRHSTHTPLEPGTPSPSPPSTSKALTEPKMSDTPEGSNPII